MVYDVFKSLSSASCSDLNRLGPTFLSFLYPIVRPLVPLEQSAVLSNTSLIVFQIHVIFILFLK